MTEQTTKKMPKKMTIRTGEEAFSQEEYQKLLDACDNLQDEVMLKTGVALGIRRGDTNKIKIADIDFTNHTLMYHEQKKKNRVRIVPMEPKLEQTIVKYLKTLDKGTEYLFPSGVSKWGDKTLWNRLNALCDKAKIPRRKFHALRATCVKFHQRAGWTVEQTAELIGDTVAVVQLHYSTPSKAELMELAKNQSVV